MKVYKIDICSKPQANARLYLNEQEKQMDTNMIQMLCQVILSQDWHIKP